MEIPGSKNEIEKLRGRISELESSLEESRSMIENAPDFIVKMDRDGRILDLNRAVAGLEKKDLIGADSFLFVLPEHRNTLKNALTRVFKEGISVNYEVQGAGGEGKTSWYSSHLGPILQEGRVVAATLVARDITDLRMSEDQVRESDQRFRKMFEISSDAIFLINPRTNLFLDANPSALESVGYTKDELLSLRPSDLQSGKETKGGFGEELYHRRKDGTLFPILETRTSIQFGGETLEVSIVRDITAHKSALEEQLRQIQKMEAVGQLAGGIAHDFNQKLSAIIGFSELAMRKLSPSVPVYTYVEEIRNAGIKASAVIDQLLAFSRKQQIHPVALDMNAILANLDATFGRLIGEDIEREAQLGEGLGKILLDPGQAEQIIVNLAVNARDAMDHGGKLLIETSNVELEDLYARNHLGVSPGPHVRIRVRDTGIGMDPETMSRIFEPFFTTKENGKGTGLGLATVFGIVRQNGGHVTVESVPGKGTTFSIIFPRVAEPSFIDDQKDGLAPLPEGDETILLVEDEDEVRRMAREALSLGGYTVLEASHGGEALEIADRFEKPIDIMVTDLVMPRMSGRELAEQMQEKRPGMKILYVSGYVDKAFPSSEVLSSGSDFLRKPLTPENLTRKIRDILGPLQAH